MPALPNAAQKQLSALASLVLAATLLATTVVVAITPAAPAAAACAVTSKPDMRSARELARTCRKRVPVTGATTTTSTLLANENGSFTVTESAVPERIRRADGTWVPVDTTLHTNGDGSVSPVASPTSVILSGGGAGFLARTAHDGRELIWTWTGHTLPRPTLSGAVATYPEVLSGVDLKVHVDQWGFSEVLVVKNPAAAADPALASLGFALTGSAVEPGGHPRTPDEAVSDAFRIGEAHMWDSTMPAQLPKGMPAVDVREEFGSSIDGPGSAARTALMPLAMNGNTMVVTPVRSLLTGRTTKFPVYLDPKSTSPARSYWAMINSQHPSQQYWTYDRADHAKVGNAGTGKDMYRSLFQFNTATWKGKHVVDAQFADNLVHSWSCSNTSTQLHLVTQTIGSNTTWNLNAPAWGASSLASVSNQNCHDASGVASEWHTNALTTAINNARGNASVTLGLRAADETVSTNGSNGWKKFDETSGAGGAHLSVTYNTAPVLSNLHTDAAGCGTSASTAPLLSTVGNPAHNPVPQVTVKDGEGDATTVSFTYPKPGGGTFTTSYPNVVSGGSQKLVGGIGAAAVPTGAAYSWSVTVSDGTDSAGATCFFKVDNTIPQKPDVTSADGVYPDDDTAHGGVGHPGRFTLAAVGTDANKVVKYVWGPIAGGAQQTVTTTAGAPVTVSYTPGTEGDNTIQAYAYTATGVVSAPGSADFLVGQSTPATGQWLLDGDGTDAGPGRHPATATDVTWLDGARQIDQSVAHFNGTSSALTAAVPIHTDTSFAVSAWIRPAGTTCEGSAVSQDGAHTSGFYLGCFQGKYNFDVIQSDSSTVVTTRVNSATTVPIGVWSNVVGVYDLSANTVSLYANGVLQGSRSLAAPLWDAAGPFVIGREKYVDVPTGWWNGDVADVRVWDRVLYPDDLAGLSAASWADQFPLDDPSRNTRRDNPLTWQPDQPDTTVDNMNPPDSGGTPAVLINSEDTANYATTAGPSVRTDGSFTVSAWVDPIRLTGGNLSAVSQRGVHTSNFSLGVSAADQYQFRMNDRDAVNPGAAVLVAPGTAVAGQWVHLTGTYDFTARRLTLYVDGVPKATTTATFAPWHATGSLLVGAAFWNDGIADPWPGGLDNVGVFNGVLTATQIQNLYRFNNPFYVAEG